MEGDTVHKQYLARVQGDFRKACNEETKDVTVNKWVYMKDYKRLFHGFAEEKELTEDMRKTAKDAETRFEMLYYDEISDMSVVKCYPKTGRTHQIRVHLQSLGYPIGNDMMYGGKIVNDGKGREPEWEEDFEGCFEGEEKEITTK